MRELVIAATAQETELITGGTNNALERAVRGIEDKYGHLSYHITDKTGKVAIPARDKIDEDILLKRSEKEKADLIVQKMAQDGQKSSAILVKVDAEKRLVAEVEQDLLRVSFHVCCHSNLSLFLPGAERLAPSGVAPAVPTFSPAMRLQHGFYASLQHG